MLSAADLRREAAVTGFQSAPLEKAIRLVELLDELRKHPFLKTRMALKGGTALNLFIFDLPRLSVDIDLNYIGAADLATMKIERPQVEQAIQAVCGRIGLQVKRLPSDHAGGKWRLSYTGATGRPGNLELDLNFLLRTPLWPPKIRTSKRLGSFDSTEFPLLDLHELASGKLAALFARSASRDLFDVREILQGMSFDRDKLRLGFLVYGGMNRKDWRSIALEDIGGDPGEADQQLVPLLRGKAAPSRDQIVEWSKKLLADCRRLLSAVFPLATHEQEFIERLNQHGEIAPDLITNDEGLQAIIRSHPGLLWKARNVREHHGLPAIDGPEG